MPSTSSKTGILIINVGTPEAPHAPEVGRYLGEFLMDPYVIDISAPMRWLLVHGLILRTRPARSAEAYRKIWTEEGSPLLIHLRGLAAGMQTELDLQAPGQWVVEGGMRYGRPSIQEGLKKLQKQGVSEVIVFPLYPQYSLAATESAVVHTRRMAARVAPKLKLRFVPAFYEKAPFIEAFVDVAERELKTYRHDHVLFSFHGLPERQIKKTDATGSHCLASSNCCDRVTEANQDCYRAQCYATARAIASRLKLSQENYTVCFQSRLGRTPWIQPFTDHLLTELPQKGIKRLAVLCPAFVADCLETLEEIQIRGRQDFIARGGEDLKLVSSLNSSPVWAKGAATLAQQEAMQ